MPVAVHSLTLLALGCGPQTMQLIYNFYHGADWDRMMNAIAMERSGGEAVSSRLSFPEASWSVVCEDLRLPGSLCSQWR